MRKLLLSVFSAAMFVQGSMMFTVEAPGVQQSSLPDTTVETFDVLLAGAMNEYISSMGIYSGGMSVVNPNAWGGAGQTRYLSVGAQSGHTLYVLDLFTPQSYFGLYWGAADSRNELRFYSDDTLIGQFRTLDVMGNLSSAYNGNPNTGQNLSEKYAFVNFFTTGNASFNRIEFHNAGTSTGFETDNHTFLLPRDPVTPTVEAEAPEPATMLLTGLAVAGLGMWRRARRAAR